MPDSKPPPIPPPPPPAPLPYYTPGRPAGPRPSSGKEAYNIVTDTVIGVNARKWDNLFQAVAILVCLVLGVGIGFLATKDAMLGMMAGGFIGLLAGLFGSGLFLMIYRAVRHAKGKHD